MSGSPENPPAFPFPYNDSGNFGSRPHTGMSLRDWFAGQALAGMMANADMPFAADAAEIEPRQIAEAVFELADALLAARGDK